MAERSFGKRFRINKLQQQMMMAVLGASLLLGVSIVVSIHLTKYMNFNAKVIKKRDEARMLEFVRMVTRMGNFLIRN